MFKKLLKILFITCFYSVLGQNGLVINEFLSSNINGLIDTEYGESKDWIEIYNSTDSLIDLSNYFLTDNISDSTFWQFPTNTQIDSGGYLLIWADGKDIGLHTNFKLDSDGEQIFIFDQNRIIVDSVVYGKQRTDVSFGRQLDSSTIWLYFAEPTPGAKNNFVGTSKKKLSDSPEFSEEGGIYSFPINLELFGKENSKVFYTLDGSVPSISTATEYTETIQIDSSLVVRAILVEDGLLPSEIITNTYIIDESTTLPIVSISTDPKNLWDDKIGIYTIGTNGLSSWGVKANYWQDWERPIDVEFFEDNKSLGFKMKAGIAINGARRNMLQKSLRINARKEYDNEFINYKIFPEKEIRQFSSLVLRNGGYPEFRSTMLRDGFMQSLISDAMELEDQAYRPCVLYINGQYWGIFNIREKQNEEYLKENSGIDPNKIDMLENNMIVIEGDKDHYQNMINFIETNNLSIQENYDSVKKWMDIPNYIDYQIAQIYFANNDWPANNLKYWRPRTTEGKWRWMLFDVDGGFGLNVNYDFNSIEYATAEDSKLWNNTPWSTFLLRNLLKNEEFANQFLQKFTAHLNFTFDSDLVVGTLDKFIANIEDEFPKHIDRWAADCSPENPETKDGCLFNNIDIWYQNLSVVENFAFERPGYIFDFLGEYFSIHKTFKIDLSTNSEEYGSVFINGVRAKYNKTSKFFAEKKIVLEAKPIVGYRFVAWTGSIESSEAKIELDLSENISLNAVFETNNLSSIPSVINSVMELSADNSPYIAPNEIFIYENATLSINEGVEIKMPANANVFVYGSLKINGTKNNPVLIHSDKSEENWGAINFINAERKSTLSHIKIRGTSNGKDLLSQIGGISSYNSDIELNYLDMDSVQFPIYVEYGNFIMRNSKIHSKVISDFVNVKYGSSIIEGSEFIGDYAIDTDAIDYDDTKTGIIRRNKIHNFLGENSDAIDIGEGAQNVLIEENIIYNCSDKGISIGQASSAIIRGNIIANCNLGVGIKDNLSFGEIDHNTFYENNIAVSCFEKVSGRGGGNANITNTIFSNSISSDIFADELSEITVDYSLSDRELLDGIENLFGNPDFINPSTLDFRVEHNSITINSGDPTYELDPDGSRTNIGTSFYSFNKNNSLVISEINYNSSPVFDTKDWIEFYNPNDSDLDISNWIFKDSRDDHSYIFEYGTVIKSNDFIVLCEDTSDFKKFNPNVPRIFGEFNFGLNNSGEKLRIFDNYGNIIDSLTYYDQSPWPVSADGDGYTLQLINYEFDNSDVSNWNAETIYGSPGEHSIVTNIFEENVNIPKEYNLYQNYPNPFNPSTRIKYEIPKTTKVSLKIYDILGREVSTLFDETKRAGVYQITFNSFNLSTPLASGIYFYRFSAGDFIITKKMILLK